MFGEMEGEKRERKARERGRRENGKERKTSSLMRFGYQGNSGRALYIWWDYLSKKKKMVGLKINKI